MWLASPMSTCDIKMKNFPFFHEFLGICPNMFFSLFFPYSSTNKNKHLKKPSFSEVYLRVFGFYLSWWHVASSTSRLALNQSLQVPFLLRRKIIDTHDFDPKEPVWSNYSDPIRPHMTSPKKVANERAIPLFQGNLAW